MLRALADSITIIDGANMIVAVIGLIAAGVALIQSRSSNRIAKESNEISRSANELSAKTLQMQEDESRVRLVVRPKIVSLIGDDEDSRPRPLVEVINLSSFPVTITKICWKSNLTDSPWFYWKNPTLASPFDSLPARLPPREVLVAVGSPTGCTLGDLKATTAAVAFTACGEQIEGMTPDWQREVARLLADAEAAKTD